MDGEQIFSIDEESDAGGCSSCWVEKRKKGFVLFGNELGKMAGPCSTVVDALNESGFEFGMDYMRIECTVSSVELQEILESPAFILSNVYRLWINGVEGDPDDIEKTIVAYRESRGGG